MADRQGLAGGRERLGSCGKKRVAAFFEAKRTPSANSKQKQRVLVKGKKGKSVGFLNLSLLLEASLSNRFHPPFLGVSPQNGFHFFLFFLLLSPPLLLPAKKKTKKKTPQKNITTLLFLVTLSSPSPSLSLIQGEGLPVAIVRLAGDPSFVRGVFV